MSSLRLFRFLLQNAKGVVAAMLCASAVAGAFSAGLLAVISRTLHSDAGAPLLLALAFSGLAIGKIVSTSLAQLLLVRFSQGSVLDLSLVLCSKILRSPLRLLERHGSAKVLTTLTDDVSSVTWGVQCFPQLAMNAAIIFGCAVYLAWLSWQMFIGAALVTVIGAWIHKRLHDHAADLIREARDARTTLFEHFRALSAGTKELMMSSAKRQEFLNNDVRATAERYRQSNLAATKRYALADAWMQGLYYGLIGLMLFAFPQIAEVSAETLSGYAFAMLYLMSPLWSIIGALPAVVRGQVALEKIEELGVELADAPEETATRVPVPSNVHELQMRGLHFLYEAQTDERPFELGPLDFTLKSGELVFVIGGNGSGKSTFVKLLAGLYSPTNGEITLDGESITKHNQDFYREHFTIIFADGFLFPKLLGMDKARIEEAGAFYLDLLGISDKVMIRDGRFSTVDLSQGQRKRLAMVTAYLEDRPFYVFDEWAAEQDPEYREVFYSKLLPDLRSRGKGVVVITHDDRYFHLGDRIIKLDKGQLIDAGQERGDQKRRAAVV